jgi:septum formation topological specificity factor MinE
MVETSIQEMVKIEIPFQENKIAEVFDRLHDQIIEVISWVISHHGEDSIQIAGPAHAELINIREGIFACVSQKVLVDDEKVEVAHGQSGA